MVIGIGTDILQIDRLRRNPEDLAEGAPFLRKTFTDSERQAAADRPDPVLYYSTRFAGKEAVFKALGTGDGMIRLNQIEILNDPNGQPQVTLHGRAKEIANARQVTDILISLSYENDYAVAVAIMQNNS